MQAAMRATAALTMSDIKAIRRRSCLSAITPPTSSSKTKGRSANPRTIPTSRALPPLLKIAKVKAIGSALEPTIDKARAVNSARVSLLSDFDILVSLDV